MDGYPAGLRRLDGIVWAIIGAVAVAVLIATVVSDFHLVWRSFLPGGAAVALLLAGHWIYSTRRPDARLANALAVTAQIIAFGAVGAPLSYVAASFDLPLQDRWTDGADRFVGPDWNALLHWTQAHAGLHPLFSLLYLSLLPQTVGVVLILAVAQRFGQMRVFILATIFATLIAIALATAVPAAGVWGYYHLRASEFSAMVPAVHGQYLPVFRGLRDGALRGLVGLGAQGIMTFPSLHAALALILIDAFGQLPVLRWVALVANGVMVLVVPIEGGHYFIDVLAGLVIAAVCLAAARLMVSRFVAVPQDVVSPMPTAEPNAARVSRPVSSSP